MASADGLNFAELSKDLTFVFTNQNFDQLIIKIEEQIQMALKLRENPELSLNDSIKIDNYLAFAMNTLYWMYLKIQGSSDNMFNPPLDAELSRSRKTVTRDKELDAKVAAPRLDVPVARRLIAHGLHIRLEDNAAKNDTNTKEDLQ